MDAKIEKVIQAFDLPEGEIQAQPFGNGHINRTYAVEVAGALGRYILQQINQHVFHHPDQVQENILRVTDHLRRVILAEGGDPERETLRVILTREGRPYARDEAGDWWRMFPFVEETYSLDLPDTEALFEKCGGAFGLFQRRLNDFPAEQLHETIPHFHDTPWRLAQLEEAARKDAANRLGSVRPELDFFLARASWVGRLTEGLAAGELPLRVTHNDTKLNNVLLDLETGEAICVVDLVTVMPGLMAYDFGDAIRTEASTAAEDERDLRKIGVSLPMVRAYARGFLGQVGAGISPVEKESLAWGARMMTMENGIRFLTDYLDGDHYFAIHRPEHNLDRARAQMTLVTRMEEQWDELRAAVEEI